MEPRITRTREVIPWYEWLVSGNWQDYAYNPTYVNHTGSDYVDAELLLSSGHPFSSLGKDDGQDIGGDFKLVKRSMTKSSSFQTGPQHFSQQLPWGNPMNPGVNHIYCEPVARIGFVTSDTVDMFHGEPSSSSGSEMDFWGAKAIEKCIPTNPVAEAQVLAGNTLQKGLPKIPFRDWEKITRTAKYAGNNYLNLNFGWKPFVSDLRKLGHAIKERDSILTKYHAESGKLLHRSYHFPEERVCTTTIRPGTYYPAPFGDSDYFIPHEHVGRLTETITTVTNRWFKGTFTYYLPKMGSVEGHIADANKLLGAGITPEVVWDLTPWSWAINWFVDTGTLVHNLSQFIQDGLVMPYAYIMEHTIVTSQYHLEGVAFKSYPGRYSFTQTFKTEVKQRRAATPWGFGSDFDGFTDRQTAIIAALGLSHNRGAGTINPDG
jgi:hypothetical protein